MVIDMALTDICRLCLSKDNLVWVFDKRFDNADSIRFIISVTTGVEINITDNVSQKICEKCCLITIKFYDFRKKSYENDNLLKEKAKALFNMNDNKIKEEPPDVTSRKEPLIPVHPSVRELYEQYPRVKLPRKCLKVDVKPFVIMQMDVVENYFKSHKLDFQECCKQVLKEKRTARKKTGRTATNKPLPLCRINAQIVPQQVEEMNQGLVQSIKIKIISNVPVDENKTKNDNIETSKPEASLDKKAPALCNEERNVLEKLDDEAACKINEKSADNCISTDQQDISKSLSYVTNVSVPLQMCNICDSVHQNPKDFKKHRLKHLRCQFCKTTFRSLVSKSEHLQNKCLIKNTLNRIPSVEVPKIENNKDILKKYAKAFSDFPTLVSVQDRQCSKPVILSDIHVETHKTLKLKQYVTEATATDVIEILSDDEEESGTHNRKENLQVISPKVPVTVPTIKPNVKLKNSKILDILGPTSNEIVALKNLLTHIGPLKISSDNEVQTETPHNNNVEVNNHDRIAVLNDFKQHLHVFRVPIDIKIGTFNVKYNTSTDKPSPKNLRLWNDMSPVDIRKNKEAEISTQNTNTSNDPVIEQVEEIIPLQSLNDRTITSKDVDENGIAHPTSESLTECDKNTSESDFDKSVTSTHRQISVVGLSATCTFPVKRKNVTPISSSEAKKPRILLPISTAATVTPTATSSISIPQEITLPECNDNFTRISSENPTSNNQNCIENSINPPNSVVTSSSFNPNKNYIEVPVNTSNPVVTALYWIPPNNISTVTASNPTKPIRFKIPSLYQNNVEPVLKPYNVFDERKSENTQTTNQPTSNNYHQSTSTVFSVLTNRTISSATNSLSYSNTCDSVISAVSNCDSSRTFWPPSCNATQAPTIYSTGYSNVPVMVINNRQGTSIAESLQSTRNITKTLQPASNLMESRAPNNYLSTTQQNSTQPTSLSAIPNSRRNSASTSLNYAYTNKYNYSQVPPVVTAVPNSNTITLNSSFVHLNNYFGPNINNITTPSLPPNNLLSSPTSIESSSARTSPKISSNISTTSHSCLTSSSAIKSCSIPANTNLGHIRVRNMKELI